LPNPASAHAGTPGEIDAASATLRQRRAGALLVDSGTFFPSRRRLATLHRPERLKNLKILHDASDDAEEL
jgi:hypothetical protein